MRKREEEKKERPEIVKSKKIISVVCEQENRNKEE